MELAHLYRSLAALHRAGLPWPEALAAAAPGRLGGAWARLEAGRPLAEALAEDVPALDAALLRAGEHSGTLEAVLERLAARHEEEARQRGARRAALAYPLVLVHVAALLLPLPDWIAGRLGAGLLWSAGILLPTHALLWLARARRVAPGRAAPPAIGPWRSAVEEADARALSVLADVLDAGMALGEGLGLAAAAGAGGRAGADLERARAALDAGRPLAASWRALPGDLAGRLAAAEQAGELAAAARREAGRLLFEVGLRRQRTAAILPVVVLLVAGVLIAWRVISFYATYLQRAGL